MSKEYLTPEEIESYVHLKEEISKKGGDSNELKNKFKVTRGKRFEALGQEYEPTLSEIEVKDNIVKDEESGLDFGVHLIEKEGAENTMIFSVGWHTNGRKEDFPLQTHFEAVLSHYLNANIICIDDLGCGDSDDPQGGKLKEMLKTSDFTKLAEMKGRVADSFLKSNPEFKKRIFVGGLSQGAVEALTMATLKNWPKDIPIEGVIAIDPAGATEKSWLRIFDDFVRKEGGKFAKALKASKTEEARKELKVGFKKTFWRPKAYKLWQHYAEIMKKPLLPELLEKIDKPTVLYEGFGPSDEMLKDLGGAKKFELERSYIAASDKVAKTIHQIKRKDENKKITGAHVIGASHGTQQFDANACAMSIASKLERLLGNKE